MTSTLNTGAGWACPGVCAATAGAAASHNRETTAGETRTTLIARKIPGEALLFTVKITVVS